MLFSLGRVPGELGRSAQLNLASMVGCASILSAYVAVLPEHFRSRRGSMMAASCSVAAMWVAAAVITALTLMGEIQS